MKKSYSVTFLFSILIFFSCNTDIDVNAPYEDITIIYGLIDPADSVHYIKINKAFSGEIDANELANDPANFNYSAEELDVIMEEYDNNNNKVKDYSLIRTVNEITKDPGVFANNENVLYKFTEPSINTLHSYKLRVINKIENKEVSSTTEIIGKSVISNPTNTSARFQFYNGTFPSGTFNDRSILLTAAKDIGRVEAVLVFHYNEHYTTSSGLSPAKKEVVMSLGELKTRSPEGNESLEWVLKGETFIENIEANVPETVPFLSHRELDNISLEFKIAGTELSIFMDVNEPSTSINQEKPAYTNIDNGLGVFSSQTNLLWISGIDPSTANQVNILNSTIKYLQSLNRGFCFGTTGVGFPVAPCVQAP